MLDKIRKNKLRKLQNFKDAGIDPYPAKSSKDGDLIEVLKKNIGDEVKVAGRIVLFRVMGNIAFLHLQDESGRVQIVLNKKELETVVTDNKTEVDYKFWIKNLDLGDFIGIEGKRFDTQKGEKSILAKNVILLAKSILPLPDKQKGLQNEDDKLRKRYLDIALNPKLRELFKRRAKFWNAMREFMNSKGFFEVETPSIEVTTGGAEARPFKTWHNDFDMPVFMRISIGELWQKRLMAAGFEKTFEIGRAFRNEGSSSDHLQEFTNMEFYWAYVDYNDGMELVKEMYRYIAKEVYGKTKFEARGMKFDLADEWCKIDYVQEVLDRTGVDILKASEQVLEDKLEELKVKYEGKNRERLVDSLWKYCRQSIAGPAFLVNHPTFIAPLSKQKEDNPKQVEKFQPILGGAEVGNGYSELNDPIDQRKRFEKQNKLLKAGDDEAMMPDWEFVEMLEYGMPPTCGFGTGERLFAFLEDKTLREITLFPLTKPKEINSNDIDEQQEGCSLKRDGTKGSDGGDQISSLCQNEQDKRIQGLGITLDQANELVDKYITDPITKLHSQESQLIMQAIAKYLKLSDELVKKYGIIGLLHDLDWDMTKENSAEHSIKTAEILKEFGTSDFLIDTIQSHNYGYEPSKELRNKVRTTVLQHSLAAAETLTGLIVAASLILPTKTVKDLKLKSLKKKFKTKKFAERCDRDIILECEKIGLGIDEFLEIGLRALQEGAEDLGI